MDFELIIILVVSIISVFLFPISIIFVSKLHKKKLVSILLLYVLFKVPIVAAREILSPVYTHLFFEIDYVLFAVLLNLIEVISFVIFFVLYSFILNKISFERMRSFIPNIDLYNRNYILLFSTAAIFSFLLLTIPNFGLIEWLLSPRDGYQFGRSGAGLEYALFLTISGIFIFFLAFKSINSKIFTRILLILIAFFIAYLTGSKGFIYETFIAVGIILYFYKKINFRHLIAATPVVLGLLLINLFSRMDIVEFIAILEYFDFYKNSATFYTYFFENNNPYEYGLIQAGSFWDLVPRAFYESKPFFYGEGLLVKEIYPFLEAGHTPGFGGPVGEYVDFGILGVLFSGMFNITTFMYALFWRLLSFNNDDSLPIDSFKIDQKLALIVLVSPGFLTFFSFPFNYFLFATILLLLIIPFFRFRRINA